MKRTSKKQTAADAVPYAQAVRLQTRCCRCRAEPGQKCKDYRGRGKAMCPVRGLAVDARPGPVAAAELPELNRPVRQGSLFEFLDPAEGEVP